MPSPASTTPTMPTLFAQRSVSPLDGEPIVVPPEDILYPASDNDYSLEWRRNKRRRIEAQGQRYLEGKPLFIMAAGMRGPFEAEWVNPYKHKKRTGILRISDKQEIIDLTQPDAPPGPRPDLRSVRLPRDNVRDVNQPSGAHTRESVVSDLGPRQSSLLAVAERRAKCTDLAAKPQQKGGTRPNKTMLPSQPRTWLKTDAALLSGGARPVSNSPSPTPTVRQSEPIATPAISSTPTTSRVAGLAQEMTKETPPPEPVYGPEAVLSGFTPINMPTPTAKSSKRLSNDPDLRPAFRPSKDNPLVEVRPELVLGTKYVYREASSAETNKRARHGYNRANTFPHEAKLSAQDEEGYREARRLAQQGALQASQRAFELESIQAERSESSSAEMVKSTQKEGTISNEQDNLTAARDKKKLLKTPRHVPPSGDLSSFKYKIARKIPIVDDAAEPSRFARQLKAAKAKSEARLMKHLSFTSSGGVRSFGSRSTSRASSTETRRPRFSQQDRTSHPESDRVRSSLSQTETSTHTDGAGQKEPSDVLPEGPEAQAVQAPIGPSGPSTDVLETDKQSLKFVSTDEGEGDSYMNLSTQAALLKAQQGFEDTIISPVHNQTLLKEAQLSPTMDKSLKANVPVVPLSMGPGTTEHQPITPLQAALSTQAIMDGISPFAITTIKKQGPSPVKPANLHKRASFAASPLPSPIHTFGTTRQSLSMSTSPEIPSPTPIRSSPKRTPATKPPPVLSKASTGASKRPSTATSTAFSIAPDGTSTEVYQQDGQQQYDPFMGIDSEWNLDEALEQAGSFLETLDVDAEARKGGTRLKIDNGS